MEGLTSLSGKLLVMVYDMHMKKKINSAEKAQLKGTLPSI